MARIDWNQKNLAKLKAFGDKGHFKEIATIFNCTENAVKVKYGRIKRAFKEDVVIKTSSKNHKIDKNLTPNPFKIEQVVYTGLRATPEIVVLLAKQMMNLKANKLDSISIPLTISKTKRESSNLFQQAKNHISKTVIGPHVFTIKSTFSGDNAKTYLGARIWRVK